MDNSPLAEANGYAVSRDLNPRLTDVALLKPLSRQTRKHPPTQIRKLQSSIEQFGFVLPIVVDAESRVIAGCGLVLAAKRMGLRQVPAVMINDLDEAKLRLLRLALDRLGEEASWDFDALAMEFTDILEIDIDVDLKLAALKSATSTSPSLARPATRKTSCPRSTRAARRSPSLAISGSSASIAFCAATP